MYIFIFHFLIIFILTFTVRFTEDASMEEKQEILCKLEQSGDLTLDEQTLKEIMKIKDAVEKKREYGIL